MSAARMLLAMVTGTALVMLVGARRAPAPTSPVAPSRVEEEPWLSKEAAAQIVGTGGTLGPLFAGVELGGPAPSIEVRERIERFARRHRVDIELEVVEAQLASIRFAVTYGGCCGYEGADVLAMRLRRPSTGNCCVCGTDTWINDWALANDGTYVRTSVRVNRVEVRWERVLSLTELIERANALIGQDAATVRASARERWVVRKVPSQFHGEPDAEREFLAMPYVPAGYPIDYALDLRRTDELGLQLVVEAGRIAEVSLAVRELENADTRKAALKMLGSIWGRPTAWSRQQRTWQTQDRRVIAELWWPRLTIRKR